MRGRLHVESDQKYQAWLASLAEEEEEEDDDEFDEDEDFDE